MNDLENTTVLDESLEEISITSRGQMKDIVKRFLRNRAAVLGLAIIIVLVICAVFPGLPHIADDRAQLSSHRLRHRHRGRLYRRLLRRLDRQRHHALRRRASGRA